MTSSLVLLTGATGYVGRRLLKRFEALDRPVRCLVRRPEFLMAKAGAGTEVIPGDVLDAACLASAMAGIRTAYYMVHSMAAGSFEERDRAGAHNFADAARRAGLRRIIYLGGLADSSGPLSPHLRSRQEVGEILRSSGVEVIEFRASIVIGSGSLSFEMIRALVERLPMMITPRWVSVRSQPIAINDLLDYLLAALELPEAGSSVFEIGGPDQVSYGDLMREYARQRGLRRIMIKVPVLSPRLSSLWLGLVTPLYARIGRKLIDSIRNPSVIRDHSASEVFNIRPMGVREAIEVALRTEDREFAETRWPDALSSLGPPPQWGGVRFGNRIVDVHTVHVGAPPEAAFAPIRRIGGNTGWYYGNWLWRSRGWMDLVAGGTGMRRGRRDPERLRVGDVVDWWRVEAYEPERRPRLAAEMKLPGRAWLEFEVTPDGSGSTIRQTAIYDPVGLGGLAYWYSLYLVHQLIFSGMLRRIAEAAVGETNQSVPPMSRPLLAALFKNTVTAKGRLGDCCVLCYGEARCGPGPFRGGCLQSRIFRQGQLGRAYAALACRMGWQWSAAMKSEDSLISSDPTRDLIRIGISACLLGERVRFDGGYKHDRYLTQTLGPYFEWVPVCPEVEIGLGTPRETMRLEQEEDGIRMVMPKSGRDLTAQMRWIVQTKCILQDSNVRERIAAKKMQE